MHTHTLKKEPNGIFIVLGIGTLDVALVPLLASIVDSKYTYDDDTVSVTSCGTAYGGIYAIQQIRFIVHLFEIFFYS